MRPLGYALYSYLRDMASNHPADLITIILFFSGIIAGLYKFFTFIIKQFKNRSLDRDLHPFLRHSDIHFLTSKYINHRLITISPNGFDDPVELLKSLTKANTVSYRKFYREFFDINNPTRFYALLGDSGIGKSTLSAKLFQRYHSQFRRPFKIKIIPLGHPYALTELDNLLPEAKNTILFLDGFDELTPMQRKQFSIDDLHDKIWTFRKVLLSCRTHYFEKQQSEPGLTPLPDITNNNFHRFKNYYIAPFSDRDVHQLVSRIFPIYRQKLRRKAINIVNSAKYLLIRPFLLKNIGFIINSEALKSGDIYSLLIYATLIDSWIERDLKIFKDLEERKKHKEQAVPLLTQLAITCFTSGQPGENYLLTPALVASVSRTFDISLDFIKVRSLLTRDNLGNIKFAHKSVFEYFLAKAAITDPELREKILSNPALDVARAFLNEHYFYNEVKPYIQSCEGYFYEINSKIQLPLTAIKISSLYTIQSLHFTRLAATPALNNLDLFKNLRTIIFHFQHSGISMADVYAVFFVYWRSVMECFHQILSKHMEAGIQMPGAWLDYYEAIYKMNRKRAMEAVYNREGIDVPDFNWLRKKQSITAQNKNPIKLLIDESDIGAYRFCKMLFNERLDHIVAAICQANIANLRALDPRRLSLLEYKQQILPGVLATDQLMEKINAYAISDWKILNESLGAFLSLDILQHKKLRLIY